MLEKIGFVGVGRMGANMARRLKECGYEITALYDVNTAAAQSLAQELGTQAAPELKQVTKLSDVIITVVTDDKAMKQIYQGGLLSRSGLCICSPFNCCNLPARLIFDNDLCIVCQGMMPVHNHGISFCNSSSNFHRVVVLIAGFDIVPFRLTPFHREHQLPEVAHEQRLAGYEQPFRQAFGLNEDRRIHSRMERNMCRASLPAEFHRQPQHAGPEIHQRTHRAENSRHGKIRKGHTGDHGTITRMNSPCLGLDNINVDQHF